MLNTHFNGSITCPKNVIIITIGMICGVIVMLEAKLYSQEIGRRLRHFRTQRGLSQEQLALNSGLNTNSIGMIERGLKSPTLVTLKRVCDSLDITLAQLFLHQGETLPPDNGEAIQKVTALMSTLSPVDAERVAKIVEQAVAMGRQ